MGNDAIQCKDREYREVLSIDKTLPLDTLSSF
jgi:hypothetical protein